jgi:hypothetical protein
VPKAPAKGGTFLSRKTGGIPNVVLIAAGGLVIYLYLSKKNAAGSATNPAAAQSAALAAQQQSYQQAMAASAYYPAQGSATAQQPVYVVNGSPGGVPAATVPRYEAVPDYLANEQYAAQGTQQYVMGAAGQYIPVDVSKGAALGPPGYVNPVYGTQYTGQTTYVQVPG